VESEANANQTKLQSAQIFLPQMFSEQGLDFEDEVEKAATAFGVTGDEMRKRLLDATLKPTIASVSQQSSPGIEEAVAAAIRNLARRNEPARMNGAPHVN
jgi:hypothetical protein